MADQLPFPNVWQEDWYCPGCHRRLSEDSLPDGTIMSTETESGIVMTVWCICGTTVHSDYRLSQVKKRYHESYNRS